MNCASKRAWACALATAVCGSLAEADQVRHLFDSDTSLFSLETNGACGALTIHRDTVRCNPALIRSASVNSGVAELTSFTDEPAFRALLKLTSQQVTAGEIESLFRKNSFTYYSGFARLATATRYFTLEYVPVSLYGAYRLSNPSLPLVQVTGLKKSTFAAASALDLNDLLPNSPVHLALGAKVIYDDKLNVRIDSDAASGLAADRKDLVRRSESQTLDGNVGLFFMSKSMPLPQLGVVCDNCFSGRDMSSEKDRLQVDGPELRLTSAHIAQEFNPGVGRLWVSAAGFWTGIFEELDTTLASASLGYKVGQVVLAGSYSPARFGWGFLMQRGYYHIGLQYAFEKQPPIFQLERQQKLYLSFGAGL
jgi:hypothetical protein